MSGHPAKTGTALIKPSEALGFWAALALLTLIGVAGQATMNSVVDTMASVDHTQRVIEQLDELRVALSESESARRGYELAGDESELAGYARAVRRLRASESNLRALTADNAEQQRRLDVIRPRLAQRISMLDAAIAELRVGGSTREREVQTTKAGSEASAAILSTVSDMITEERALLALRERKTGAGVGQTRLAQIGGMIFSFALLFVAFRTLRREVARRVLSEEQAREGEESLATTLRSIGDAVISTDLEGRVERMNPVAEKLTGWKLADARRKSFSEVFQIQNEKTGEPAHNPLERVLSEGVTVGLANHTQLVAKDGTVRPIADSAAPIRESNGKLRGAVLVFRDVTVERLAAERLREASAFLDSIVENIPHMIFVKEARELRFERFNRAGEELLGVKTEQLIGKNDFDFFPKDQAEFFQKKDREVLAGKNVVDIAEEPIKTPRGERWLHTKKIPLLDAEGRSIYLLGISEDITERKTMADALRRAHDDLEQRVEERTAQLRAANQDLQREIKDRLQTEEALRSSEEQLRQSQKMEAVGRLAGGIAHDFNNLLSVILSYSAILSQDVGLDSPMKSDLEEIRRAGERATDLTRQLLAFSRQQVLAPKVVDLNDVIRSMDNMLKRLIGEDIELRTATAVRLGKVEVDPNQMGQVIMNLIVNARDALPEGGRVTIETANVDLDETYAADHTGVVAGPHVMLAVTDTGVGIDRATQDRIFEPFFTTKEKGKGTGLGLSTVFGIVKQSGGHIWVYSELRKGTTFKIYLPRVDERTPTGVPARTPSPPPGPGFETILLVEDEDQVRVLARNILKRDGYQVIDAKNGEEALLLCERFSGAIHLLATDLVMPKMSGRQLAERLAGLRPEMKVLYMSGYTDDTVVRNGALEAGVAFLQKPITPEVLSRKVRDVLDT